MKKLLVLSVLSVGYISILCYSKYSIKSKTAKNPAAPYDFFAETRSYPDKVFDLKAFEQVITQANSQNNLNKNTFAGNWQLEGPTNIGGRITCMAVSPTNTNVILIGTPGAGIYKSVNAGASWLPVFDSKPFLYIGAITFDPNNPNIIYAGTGDPDIPFTVFTGDGIYKSIDGGNTWTNIGLVTTKIISKIIVNPLNSNEVYVAAMGNPISADNNRGIYKSINGGSTWIQSLFINNQTGISDIEINPTSPNVLYATSYTCIRNATVNIRVSNNSRVYKTTTSGAAWSILSGGLPNFKVNRYSICISKQNPNKLYVAVSDSLYNMYAVYTTTNGGSTFTNMGNNGISSNYGGFGWYFSAIETNPNNDNEVYIGGVELFKSNDGGANWYINMPFWYQYIVHADIHTINFIASGAYYLGTDGGLYLTTDDGTNYADVDDIPNTQFYRVEYNPHQPTIYWGGAQDNGTCWGNASGLNNWIRDFGGDGFQPRFDPTNSNTYYVETQNGNIYSTIDGGANFNYNCNNLDPTDRRNWDMPYVLNKQTPNTQYTGTFRVYKNTGGPVDNWTAISSDLTDGLILEPRFHNISAIDNSELNSQKIYVGTSDANVWVTDNGGGLWSNITSTLPNRYVTSVHASPNFSNNVYVTHTGYKYNEYIPHIHKSTNNGTAWVNISGDLPNAGINDVLIFSGNENNLFVATDIGVYVTYNGGTNWVRVGNNMPIISVWDIAYNPTNQKLIAGTYAKSIQSIDVTTINTNIIQANKNLIEAKVYPTIIFDDKFIIECNDYTQKPKAVIYNTAGKKVKEVFLLASTTPVNVADLANGMYLVEITINQTTVVKRIIKN